MKQITIFLLLSLFITIASCKKETKKKSIENDIPSTTLTITANDSISLKLTKIYNISTLNVQDSEVKLEKNKKFAIAEKLDKLILCYLFADNGFSAFYIGSDKERHLEIKKNNEGNLEFIFDNDDHINKFSQKFHKKLSSLKGFKGEENDFLNAVDDVEIESLNQLNEIKSKIDKPSYQILKDMISGKMAHIKFMGSNRFKPLTPQSSYYDFTDSLDFNSDYYLTYSDNLNTLYSSLGIQYERKYNSSFEEASNKLEFINEVIKNDEVRSQLTCFFLSREIPEKTEKEKQDILTNLKTLKIKDNYYQHIASIEAGTALGAKIGNQAKYFETLISKNKDFNIDNFKGKTLYVDNWATWCGPCVISMKSFLNKYDALNKVKDVVFVFVSFDRNESIWRNYLKENNFPEKNVVHLYNGSDMKSNYAKYYNIVELPKYFTVDKSGMISSLSPTTPSNEGFEQFIKEIRY